MPREQKRGLGVEGGHLGKDYGWKVRTPGRKEADRGADPRAGTCAPASHSNVAVAGFGRWGFSKCPMNPGKRPGHIDAGWVREGLQALNH